MRLSSICLCEVDLFVFQAFGHAFLAGVLQIQEPGEHEEGHLFDDRNGIGDAARPKAVP